LRGAFRQIQLERKGSVDGRPFLGGGVLGFQRAEIEEKEISGEIGLPDEAA
jgi:hypothetical protein